MKIWISFLKKHYFSLFILLAGLGLLVVTIEQYFEVVRIVSLYKNAEKPTFFPVIAAVFIIISALLFLLIDLGRLNFIFAQKNKKNIFNGLIFMSVLWIGYLNYHIIKSSMDLKAYQEKRKYLVTQRLLDLQTAQQLYRRENKDYAMDFEQLLDFLKNFQEQNLIKIELKELPRNLDQLSEKEQIEQGYIRYDTLQVSVLEKYYTSIVAEKERKTKKRPDFILDSMIYAPMSGEKNIPFIFRYEIKKDFITQKETILFEIADPTPLLGTQPDTLKIGSLIENTANGNWTER